MAYKKTYYWLDTTFACGCVCVGGNGYIISYETAPIYRKVFSQKKFLERVDVLMKQKKINSIVKIAIDTDPLLF